MLSAKGRFIESFWLFASLYFLVFFASVMAAFSAAALKPPAVFCAVAVGLALRLSLVWQAPVLSDDIYTYYWNGRVAANGINPYLYPPESPQLDSLRDPLSQLVAHRHMRSIYPPIAQMFFDACYRIYPGIHAIKFALVLVDLGLCVALYFLLRANGKPPGLVLLYALSPLAILEVGHSGHIDPLGSLFLVLSLLAALRGRWMLAGIACGASAAAKLVGAVAGVFYLRQRRLWAVLLSVIVFLAAMIPYAGAGRLIFSGLGYYAEKLYFNTPFFAVLEYLVGRDGALVLSGTVFLAVLAWLAWKNPPLLDAARLGVGALLILGPVLYPWYCIWVLPLAIVTARPAWIIYCAAVVFSYLANVRSAHGGVWGTPAWAMFLEYGLLFGVGLYYHFRRENSGVSAQSGH